METRKRFQFNFAPYFRNARKSTVWAMLCLVVCMLGLGISAMAQQPKIITIDVSGAGTGAGQGTVPYYISDAGVITGWYVDASGVNHGFLRAYGGSITTINAPLAGNISGMGTICYGVNLAGAIAGSSTDNNNVPHSFLRTPDGRFTIIHVPGASQGSWADNINDAGTIAGAYVDESSTVHVYLRAPNGTITAPIDGPGAGEGDWNGTYIPTGYGLNVSGEVTGFACNAVTCHGFLRASYGAITGFDVPGAAGTEPLSINMAGEVTGDYWDTSGVDHGFLRAPNGKITTFDAPGAGTGLGQGTFVSSNNSAGAITGSYMDADGVSHGYLRTPDGRFTIFDAPGAGSAADQGEGTFPTGNNWVGVIMGFYVDVGLVNHGFLRLLSSAISSCYSGCPCTAPVGLGHSYLLP
jgi:hypothetical protein